jgi:pimeloyl-ACP methyl ester carboxylesterase
MHMQSGFASVNGTRLYYEMAGQGHPLVLLHGFALDTTQWDDQFAFFARHRRVIRYDLRGFGHSMHPAGKTYRHDEDLMALLTYLGVEKADILGHALGGMVAIDFALRFPQALQNLVLLNAYFTGYVWTDSWEAHTALIREAARREGVLAAKQVWHENTVYASCLDYPEAAARLADMISFYSGWHFVNNDPVAWSEPPASQRLHEITADTLVLVGERDLLDFQIIADQLARAIPKARKVILPDMGHMANMEKPEVFNEIVLEFLMSSSPSSQ